MADRNGRHCEQKMCRHVPLEFFLTGSFSSVKSIIPSWWVPSAARRVPLEFFLTGSFSSVKSIRTFGWVPTAARRVPLEFISFILFLFFFFKLYNSFCKLKHAVLIWTFNSKVRLGGYCKFKRFCSIVNRGRDISTRPPLFFFWENSTILSSKLTISKICPYTYFDNITTLMGVVPWWNKLALRKNLKNLHAKCQHSSVYSFRDLSVHTDVRIDGYFDSAIDLDQEHIVYTL